jgi:Secretion system C-terminal sorting domain
MKKLYILFAFLGLSSMSFAQASTSVSACKSTSGAGITITFDVSKNCAKTPDGSIDSLGKRAEIGFHSGANNFAMGLGRDWDSAPGAGGVAIIKGIRVAGTSGKTAKFTVTIPNLVTYYNAGTTAITNVAFVFNDGWDPARGTRSQWNSEGKDTKADGSCTDMVVTLAGLATCTAASQDLRSEMSVRTSPNPFKDVTYITFDNASGKNFSLSISDITGRVVRNINNITTDFVEIKRENLATGVYFAVLRDASGKFLTEKLIVQ